MISPDTPIQNSIEDRLGRADFAKGLARAIFGFDRCDSFVIAIHGKWGTGKSSVLNLCAEAIEGLNGGLDETKRVSILSFNPWNFADQGHLVVQFLRQFSANLRQFEKHHKRILKDVVERLDEYCSALASPLQEMRIGRFFSGTVRVGLKALGARKDSDSLRRAIEKQLQELKRKTVVIIDDIDRLSALEIRQIFQLVKLSARFPYVIYLLAFDKERVAHALTLNGVESGGEYLDKIVQVSFDLPPIEEAALTTFTTSGLDELLRRYPPAHFDSHRFGNLFHGGFRKIFRTLRDVRRFLNGLEFHMGLISPEVNGVDLIGMECIRTFYPRTYEVVRASKTTFAGHIDYSTGQEGPDAFRKKVDGLLESTGEREDVKGLLLELFPKIEYAYGHVTYGHDFETEWERTHRVVSSRFFEFYFQLRVPSGDVSVAEIQAALDVLPNQGSFTERLQSFIDSKRLEDALSSIRHRLELVPLDHLPTILKALVDIGDSVEHQGRSFLGVVSQFSHIRWAIFDVLKRMARGVRFEIFARILGETRAVSTVTDLVVVFQDIKDKRKEEYPDLSDELLQRMTTIAAEKLRSAADDNTLLASPELAFNLAWWGKWSHDREPKDYASSLLNDVDRLDKFLSHFVFDQHSAGMGDKVARVRKKLSARALAEFLDINKLTETLEKVDTTQTTSEGRNTLRFVKEELAKMREKRLTPEQFDNAAFLD